MRAGQGAVQAIEGDVRVLLRQVDSGASPELKGALVRLEEAFRIANLPDPPALDIGAAAGSPGGGRMV